MKEKTDKVVIEGELLSYELIDGADGIIPPSKLVDEKIDEKTNRSNAITGRLRPVGDYLAYKALKDNKDGMILPAQTVTEKIADATQGNVKTIIEPEEKDDFSTPKINAKIDDKNIGKVVVRAEREDGEDKNTDIELMD